jgi:hypothetical protein
MRLVYRDKGCVVCHAKGKDSIYRYHDDSQYFEGSHIFPFDMQSAVCSFRNSSITVEHDPF